MNSSLAWDQVAEGDALPELAVDVTATTVVLGALASRDWRPMHHDYMFATQRNGLQDVFLNTPNQAAWIERYLTDWSGPLGRIGRMTFRMRTSVYPEDRMVFGGTVTGISVDDHGCGWVSVEITLSVGETVATSCTATIALPTRPDDNPWARIDDQWTP